MVSLETREVENPIEIAQKVKTQVEKISDQIIGREDLLTQTVYALLTREHQLLFSRGGIAKSLYARVVFNLFSDAQMFRMQLTKETSEDEIVGSLNIEALKRGETVHMTEHTLVDAHFAFLDELFDGNDAALRAMLGILNEREFSKGKQQEVSPLHTAIATSNYVRANEVTEALIDRFIFRAHLRPEANPYDQLRIDRAYEENGGRVAPVSEQERIPYGQLAYVSSLVEGKVSDRKITAEDHILFLKNAVIDGYVEALNRERASRNETPLYISPRTKAKMRKVLNASALLNGRMSLRKGDLESLRTAVCVVGAPENGERIFDQTLQAVTRQISGVNLTMVDNFMEASSLYEELLEKHVKGERLQPNLIEKTKMFFGLQDISDLTFSRVEDKLRIVPDAALDPRVVSLKKGMLDRIAKDRARIRGGQRNRAIVG